ncbi:FAD-dependent oxidoreductase [Streptomyces clavuligerus]|uniref:FAD-dependent oxidoreductase n=1 Tax=Streptomyces clavuligerus TaxID=1901 RepID=UPI0001852168|nr:FAD-dependent oxidoreductase [Streptomyces clavuligerus]WDN55979.1 FAD-dependent oxidoreductase [Streptomyces clavuligerus]
MTTRPDVDLIVAGAGPAGVAAAVMAASLHLSTLLVEATAIGSKLTAIGALDNVPGNWTTGPDLATALEQDITRHQQTGRLTLLTARAHRVTGHDHHAELTLHDGRTLTARDIIVATGVTPLTTTDTPWITTPQPQPLPLPPLWRTTPDNLTNHTTIVLGADRPLGTWLRAHPDAPVHLEVLHPPADTYKTAEVHHDPRVRLVSVTRAVVEPLAQGQVRVTADGPSAGGYRRTVGAVVTNLGSSPAALAGLSRGLDGYCPPGRQHPRVHVAGDLKGARMQRVGIAMGDGGRAALTAYYRDHS